MTTNTIEQNWSDLKGKIKTQWSKFNDTDLDSMKGDLTQLSGKIEKTYGIAKEIAEQQFAEFKKTLHTLVVQEAGPHAIKHDLASATFTKVAPTVSPAVASATDKDTKTN